jgi:hypothetical protein
VNQPLPPVLDKKQVEKIQPIRSESKNKFLKIGVIIVISLVIILGLLAVYQTAIAPRLVKPTPTPAATDPIWKTKSKSNVNNFLDLWMKSVGATNSSQYASQAKDLLTIAAQAKILTYKDSKGNLITDQSQELTAFVDSAPPQSYSIGDIKQIDEKTVEVSVAFADKTTSTKIFTTKSEGDVWLIDSVRNWGED